MRKSKENSKEKEKKEKQTKKKGIKRKRIKKKCFYMIASMFSMRCGSYMI